MPFTFNDLRRQLNAAMTDDAAEPANPLEPPDHDPSTADYRYLLNVIDAMTPEERQNPDLLLDLPPRERIARAASVSLDEVNSIVALRQQIASMMADVEMMRPSVETDDDFELPTDWDPGP